MCVTPRLYTAVWMLGAFQNGLDPPLGYTPQPLTSCKAGQMNVAVAVGVTLNRAIVLLFGVTGSVSLDVQATANTAASAAVANCVLRYTECLPTRPFGGPTSV